VVKNRREMERWRVGRGTKVEGGCMYDERE
jgi:hypothetical protein